MARLANSLVRLRAEADTLAPNRSRASDGWLGDRAHAARASRHNPNDFGVVCALDLTHDPAGGFDAHGQAERVRLTPHPELDYIISRGRTAGRKTGWAWHKYTGANRHDKHVHFAVGVGLDREPRPPYDDGATSWGVHPPAAQAPTPKPPTLQELAMFSSTADHVISRYLDIIKRRPDPAGFNHWFSKFVEHEKSGNAMGWLAVDQQLVTDLNVEAAQAGYPLWPV